MLLKLCLTFHRSRSTFQVYGETVLRKSLKLFQFQTGENNLSSFSVDNGFTRNIVGYKLDRKKNNK